MVLLHLFRVFLVCGGRMLHVLVVVYWYRPVFLYCQSESSNVLRIPELWFPHQIDVVVLVWAYIPRKKMHLAPNPTKTSSSLPHTVVDSIEPSRSARDSNSQPCARCCIDNIGGARATIAPTDQLPWSIIVVEEIYIVVEPQLKLTVYLEVFRLILTELPCIRCGGLLYW